MKSQTYRITRGVRGASWEKAVRSHICSGQRRSVKVPEFEMDFCYLLQDPKRRHQPGDQAWARTLVMVDAAAKNPMSAALSTKSDEKAFLSALCTAFVIRMACAKGALKALADKIALRACTDGTQLKVETAPRFSSQSIGAVGRAQDAVEGQIRCLRLELETRLSIAVNPPWTFGGGWYDTQGGCSKGVT